MNRLIAEPALAKSAQILCIPGGFSFGDDIAAGRILASRFRQQLPDLLNQFRDDGKLILGICNGFQVLIQTGLLVDDNVGAAAKATLTLNNSGKFEDRWVYLKVASDKCAFLSGVEEMYLPIAHAEGKFVAKSDSILDQLDSAGQLALRYRRAPNCETNGRVPYPENPNGSDRHVAGICDATGRVFGLMPHPERFVTRTQHPRWTREELAETGDGMAIFTNAVGYFA
jgi:phosphoribosylformylglycinamidine synthase